MPSDTNSSLKSVDQLLITAKAVQVSLSMGERRLWELTNIGAIPSYKIGKSVRYSPAEVAGWVAAGCPTNVRAGDRMRKECNQ